MSNSTLSRFLTVFEEAQGALSIQALAASLDVSQARVEGMVEYWVRKGRIRKSNSLTDCGSCSDSGDCVFVIDLPTTYELVKNEGMIELEMIKPPCK